MYAVAIFVLYVMLPPASQIVFRTFACETLDEEDASGAATTVSRLREDYSVDCKSPAHAVAMYFAAFMVAVWPVGVPLSFAVLLFRHRAHLQGVASGGEEQPAAVTPEEAATATTGVAKGSSGNRSLARSSKFASVIESHDHFVSSRLEISKEDNKKNLERSGEYDEQHGEYGGGGVESLDEEEQRRLQVRHDDRSLDSFRLLFDAYALHAWYWEIIVTIRRLFMTGVLVIFQQGSVMQLSLGLFSCIGAALLQTSFSPYLDRHENHFALVVEMNLIVVVFIALIGMLEEEYLVGREGNVIGIFLVILTSISFVAGGAILAYEFYGADPLEVPDEYRAPYNDSTSRLSFLFNSNYIRD